ncbi:MAG: hypothetical protein MK110_07790 [Fuerstiella sp.]|nr:hypothetical protein [Fuerstiella sp.]
MRNYAVLLSVLAIGFASEHVDGQIRKFPYKAIVVRDDALVRSGGSEDYYATQRLERDALVTVHRHDQGGWLSIEPPDGSFSWIRAQYVQRSGQDAGTVTEDGCVVFVGSDFEDESSVWQRRVSSGTRVVILGEQDLDTVAGIQKMYKITPPARERRWIAGDAVVPVEETTRQNHDRDPFQAPSVSLRSPRRDSGSVIDAVTPSARLKRLQQIRSEQRRLAEIDQRFRAMLRGNPTTWDLESIESEYDQLRDKATWRPVAGQIDLRFPAIDRYRRRKAEYEDFKRLTSATERRDAELIASQFGNSTGREQELDDQPAPLNVAVADSQRSILDMPTPLVEHAELPSDSKQPVQGSADQDTGAVVVPGLLTLPGMVQPGGRYVGAGIVQRLPDGGYILTSSSGRKLAKLEPTDSVALEEFVGKSVGLHGKRWYRDDIGGDFIEVSGLDPVRIRR